MTTQRTCVYVTRCLILAICILINTKLMARSVCLPKALSFYDSQNACSFKKEDFKRILYDTARTLICHFNCSIKSTPSLDRMDEKNSYELDEMTLKFNSYDFVLVKSCKFYINYKFNIDINCEKKVLQGETCNSHKDCEKVITNSTCNNISGVCECETGHIHLLEINTCKKVQRLGESCIDSRQCKEAIPYSMCSADTCECQQGYLELNSSCLPVQQLKESCIFHKQCLVANPNTTCDNLTGVCKCSDGHLEMFNTCFERRSLGEQCNNSRQCIERSPFSTCSVDNVCRCQPSYIRVNNSCIPERRLMESCINPLQCLETTPNSTCHKTTGFCKCTKGHLMMFDTCVYGQRLVDEVCKHLKKCPPSSNNCEQRGIETVCTSLFETFSQLSHDENIYDTEKNDNSSLIIGVGVACFLLGAIIGGFVYFIINRNRTKTKLRSGKFSDDTTEQLSVQVSQHMNSRLVYNQDTRCNEEGNDVYIHLHQDTIEVNVQSDYDHVPQQMTAEDDYSHMNTCNKTAGQEPDYYGELN